MFNCGGCGARLWGVTDGREEFAAELAAIVHPEGKRMVALYREEQEAWAVLVDDQGVVTCPALDCRHRNILDGPNALRV